MTWLSGTIDVLRALGRSMFVGTLAMLIAVVFGWILGRYRWFPLVRFVAWWVDHVALPLIRSPSWRRRATTIFINNTCVLAAVLALGVWRIGGRFAVALLGISLGLALRHLSAAADELPLAVQVRDKRARRRVRIGVALNLLEPPAIVVTLGLSLGTGSIPLTLGQAWGTFAVWVVPALLLGAVGEALWLGAGTSFRAVHDVEQR